MSVSKFSREEKVVKESAAFQSEEFKADRAEGKDLPRSLRRAATQSANPVQVPNPTFN